MRRSPLARAPRRSEENPPGDPENQEETTVSIRSLNEKILRDERVTFTMLPVGDGMTVVRKK